MTKKIPAKRNPRLQKRPPLTFDNISKDDLITLTPREQTDAFMSKYLDVFNPVGKYKEYFDSSGYTISHLLKIIKQNYKTLVLDKNWDEVKFVTITNEIFETERMFAPGTYDFLSRLYDKNELESQQGHNSRIKRRL